jgi:hypothetical protein
VTREESWQVEGVTLTLLRHIAALGYTVSMFRFPPSLLGSRPGCVEMHALDLSHDPPNEGTWRGSSRGRLGTGLRCACVRAEFVGAELRGGRSGRPFPTGALALRATAPARQRQPAQERG